MFINKDINVTTWEMIDFLRNEKSQCSTNANWLVIKFKKSFLTAVRKRNISKLIHLYLFHIMLYKMVVLFIVSCQYRKLW